MSVDEQYAQALRETARLEKRVAALEAALRNIEKTCDYSPYRKVGAWDVGLARVIYHHARLLSETAEACTPDREPKP